MSAASGVGPLELAVLSAIGESAGFRRTTAVLSDLERVHAIAPAYGVQVLVDLISPWRRHLPLVEGNGNWGSPGNDPPADPTYTEVRLHPVGRLVLEAEAGRIGPVPIGLVDGTLSVGGAVHPSTRAPSCGRCSTAPVTRADPACPQGESSRGTSPDC